MKKLIIIIFLIAFTSSCRVFEALTYRMNKEIEEQDDYERKMWYIRNGYEKEYYIYLRNRSEE